MKSDEMIKAAVFDIDGTLLDSSPIWYDLGARILRSLGITPREGLHKTLSELSLKEGAEYLCSSYPLPVDEAGLLEMTDKLVSGFYLEEVAAKEGAPKLLEALKRRGVKLALATAGNARLSCAALERLGLMGYFPVVCSCEEYGGENSPEVFLAAAEKLGALPAETIVFENSLYALLTAKNAGFATAAVKDTAEHMQEELAKAADFYCERLSELLLRDDFLAAVNGEE